VSSQFYAWFMVLVLGGLALAAGSVVVPVAPTQIGGASGEALRPAARPGRSAEAANADLRINPAGLDIIKQSEGLRLEAYRAGDQWLIGYGHAATAEPGMVISQAKAEELLRLDLRATENGLKRILTVPVNENEFSAMVSLAYNLGIGGFQKTVVFERINAGDRRGAADGFLQHDRVRIDGELQSVPHLTERRTKERALFLKPA